MTAPTDAATLGALLRQLRTDRGLKQHELARALTVSVPSISAWEHAKSLPLPERLSEYARIFGAQRTDERGRVVMAGAAALTATEVATVQQLERELHQLHAAVLAEQSSNAPAQAMPVFGPRSPWQFPAGQAITIVCSELPQSYLDRVPSSQPSDPDYVAAYHYADLDALLELYGHVSSLNPNSPVQIRTFSDLTADDRTAHLILLGGIDVNELTRQFLTYLRFVPIAQQERETPEQIGSFRARHGKELHLFQPELEEAGDQRTLVADVALFLRTPNPYNGERTATLCNGMYARGSWAVVRALTDPKIKDRNMTYLEGRFGGAETYAILSRVPVVATEVVVPDWARADVRLFEWSDADR
jgi:transcriptional regulator with XRE-family HTH domain